MLNRRDLLITAAFAGLGDRGGELRGVFPILRPPERLNAQALVRQVEFVNRSGAHGVVWPSSALPPEERMAGAEIVMATSKVPVIVCVQGSELRMTRWYARQAGRIRPAAVMAAPLGEVGEHYRAIADECSRPLVAHAAGEMSLEFVLRMRHKIPTLRFVMDEAGHTLSRISEYKRAAPDLAIFSSGRGRTMPDELARGASGVMPPVRFAGVYARIWNDCRAGRREEAIAALSVLAASGQRS